jgi:hypothetical protein
VGAVTSRLSVLVRVWLPDRPGALGLVASRIGAVRGDIVGIDVLEQGDGVVIDEFAVRLSDPELVPVLVREIEEVDGASVEEVRTVARFPDPRLDALESAGTLCEADGVPELGHRLVAGVQREFLADWAALVRDGELLGLVGADRPEPGGLLAFAAGALDSPAVANGDAGPDDVAIAVLAGHRAAVLAGRSSNAFRARERYQLLALARVADRVWSLLDSAG